MYDLTIVGAGPAGSSAARTAAQLGLSTLLLEKEKVPRDKLCGGGVTPKVFQLLDFKLPDQLVECISKSTRIHVGEECSSFETEKTLVYMTSRSKFDTYLTEKAVEAGAELKDGTPVQSVGVAESYVEAKTSAGRFESKMLIGADGMGGPTASSAHLYDRWKPTEVAYAIESEVPVGEQAVQDFVTSRAYFDVHFGVSPAGYGWVFPKDDHLTVGVGCRLSKLRDAHGLFNGFVKRVPEIEGRAIPKPKAHLIPLGGVASVPYVADRILLAGDSAGFAEPLLGEGIYFAILGAQLAARTAAEACENDRFDAEFLSRYTKRCRAAFQSDFDMAYQMAKVSYLEDNDMDRVARLFFSNKRFQEFMVGLMDGSVRYRDARVKLAWPYLKYRLSKLGFPV
jgi:geranylgeranyl reductase family protein